MAGHRSSLLSRRRRRRRLPPPAVVSSTTASSTTVSSTAARRSSTTPMAARRSSSLSTSTSSRCAPCNSVTWPPYCTDNVSGRRTAYQQANCETSRSIDRVSIQADHASSGQGWGGDAGGWGGGYDNQAGNQAGASYHAESGAGDQSNVPPIIVLSRFQSKGRNHAAGF